VVFCAYHFGYSFIIKPNKKAMNCSNAWLFASIIVDVIVNIMMDEIYPLFIHDVVRKVLEMF
jgi:DMSO reductase anchor subunit